MDLKAMHYMNSDGATVSEDDLILCRSDGGDGGWSLHAPDATDEQIASGDEPPLACGPADMDEDTGYWSRPNCEDYQAAFKELLTRQRAA